MARPNWQPTHFTILPNHALFIFVLAPKLACAKIKPKNSAPTHPSVHSALYWLVWASPTLHRHSHRPYKNIPNSTRIFIPFIRPPLNGHLDRRYF